MDLGVVQVRVHEARQQEVGPRDRQGGVRDGEVGVGADPGDAARLVDRERPVADRDERRDGVREPDVPGDVEDVAAQDPGGHTRPV